MAADRVKSNPGMFDRGDVVVTTVDVLVHVLARGSTGVSVAWTFCDLDSYDTLFQRVDEAPTCMVCAIGFEDLHVRWGA